MTQKLSRNRHAFRAAIAIFAGGAWGCAPVADSAESVAGPASPLFDERPADEGYLPTIHSLSGTYAKNTTVGAPLTYRVLWNANGKKMATLFHLIVEHPSLPLGVLNESDLKSTSGLSEVFPRSDSLNASMVVLLPLARCDYRTGAYIHAQASTSFFGNFGTFTVGGGGGALQLSYTPPAITAFNMVSDPWTFPISSTGGTCPHPLAPNFVVYTPDGSVNAPGSETIAVANSGVGVYISAARTGAPPSSLETDVFYVDNNQIGTSGGFGTTLYGLGTKTIQLVRTNVQGVSATRTVTLNFSNATCEGGGGPDQLRSLAAMSYTTTCNTGGGGGGGSIDCSAPGQCTICFTIDWYWVFPDGTEHFSHTSVECYPYME